jgi:hypothetical protein
VVIVPSSATNQTRFFRPDLPKAVGPFSFLGTYFVKTQCDCENRADFFTALATHAGATDTEMIGPFRVTPTAEMPAGMGLSASAHRLQF